jgi:hypothetical protein
MDLGLVIDTSASIWPVDFKKGQEFLTDFLNGYDIGPGKQQVSKAMQCKARQGKANLK